MDTLRFILVCMAGWMNRNQQLVIEYLKRSNGTLKLLAQSHARLVTTAEASMTMKRPHIDVHEFSEPQENHHENSGIAGHFSCANACG